VYKTETESPELVAGNGLIAGNGLVSGNGLIAGNGLVSGNGLLAGNRLKYVLSADYNASPARFFKDEKTVNYERTATMLLNESVSPDVSFVETGTEEIISSPASQFLQTNSQNTRLWDTDVAGDVRVSENSYINTGSNPPGSVARGVCRNPLGKQRSPIKSVFSLLREHRGSSAPDGKKFLNDNRPVAQLLKESREIKQNEGQGQTTFITWVTDSRGGLSTAGGQQKGLDSLISLSPVCGDGYSRQLNSKGSFMISPVPRVCNVGGDAVQVIGGGCAQEKIGVGQQCQGISQQQTSHPINIILQQATGSDQQTRLPYVQLVSSNQLQNSAVRLPASNARMLLGNPLNTGHSIPMQSNRPLAISSNATSLSINHNRNSNIRLTAALDSKTVLTTNCAPLQGLRYSSQVSSAVVQSNKRVKMADVLRQEVDDGNKPLLGGLKNVVIGNSQLKELLLMPNIIQASTSVRATNANQSTPFSFASNPALRLRSTSTAVTMTVPTNRIHPLLLGLSHPPSTNRSDGGCHIGPESILSGVLKSGGAPLAQLLASARDTIKSGRNVIHFPLTNASTDSSSSSTHKATLEKQFSSGFKRKCDDPVEAHCNSATKVSKFAVCFNGNVRNSHVPPPPLRYRGLDPGLGGYQNISDGLISPHDCNDLISPAPRQLDRPVSQYTLQQLLKSKSDSPVYRQQLQQELQLQRDLLQLEKQQLYSSVVGRTGSPLGGDIHTGGSAASDWLVSSRPNTVPVFTFDQSSNASLYGNESEMTSSMVNSPSTPQIPASPLSAHLLSPLVLGSVAGRRQFVPVHIYDEAPLNVETLKPTATVARHPQGLRSKGGVYPTDGGISSAGNFAPSLKSCFSRLSNQMSVFSQQGAPDLESSNPLLIAALEEGSNILLSDY